MKGSIAVVTKNLKQATLDNKRQSIENKVSTNKLLVKMNIVSQLREVIDAKLHFIEAQTRRVLQSWASNEMPHATQARFMTMPSTAHLNDDADVMDFLEIVSFAMCRLGELKVILKDENAQEIAEMLETDSNLLPDFQRFTEAIKRA
jgi:hypothetical protein